MKSKKGKILGVTGHRPSKLATKDCYSDAVLKQLTRLAHRHLSRMQPNKVITGMALAWDTGVAIAALMLEIPVVAAVPFEGQEGKWPPQAQRRYRNLLAKIEREGGDVVVVSPGGYSAKKMLVRDQYIVDNCHSLLALWDGQESGGTYHTVSLARNKKIEVVNLWEESTTRR